MINVYLSYRELPKTGDSDELLIICNIDNLMCIKKKKRITGRAIAIGLGPMELAANMLKAYRESIRDYLYIVNGEYGLRQKLFENVIFRPVWTTLKQS